MTDFAAQSSKVQKAQQPSAMVVAVAVSLLLLSLLTVAGCRGGVVGFVPHNNFIRRTCRFDSNSNSNSNSIEIRDFEHGDGNSIRQLLAADIGENFDPEGFLEIDCGTDTFILESYSVDGCFLVAVDTGSSNNSNSVIVGTAGLVIGTSVTYLTSGASVSTEMTTGAIRRVCCSTSSEAAVLQRLLLAVEARAVKSHVDELVLLAYPASKTQRPSSALLQEQGYEQVGMELKGTRVAQFGKRLGSY